MNPSNDGRAARPGHPDFDLEGSFERLLNAAEAALAELRDPLPAEILLSEVSAAWSGLLTSPTDVGPPVVIGEGFIDYAERSGTTAAVGILRVLAVLGTDRQRAKAEAAANRLAARGVPEPVWAGELGGLRVTGCWAYGDIYGDQTCVLLGFERGGQRHSMVVAVEHNMGEIATDAFIAGPLEEALKGVAADVQRRRLTLRAISPAVARGIVEAALVATDMTSDPPLSKSYLFTRSLVLARLRVLPPAQSQAVEFGAAERAGIIADFLASTHGAELPDRDMTARCVELIIGHSCAFDQSRALRVSPMKTQVFLMAWLPLKAALSDLERAAMPSVVAAWVRWAAELGDLPEWARQELDEAVTELGAKFPAAYADPYRAGPMKSWVAGPGEKVPDVTEVGAVVDRRTFAMPYLGVRIGEKNYPELDANDETQRWLLIVGEHPEYHELLGGPEPDFTALIDAVWPQMHLITHEIVTTQLWNNDPPEAWQAAQRLTAEGKDRHDVLHELGDVVTQHLIEGTSTQQELAANKAYRRDLDSLGRQPTPHPRNGGTP
ncbi:MAG: DUF1841 family protein [Pseudonocardiaceae bacterium]